MRIQKQAEQWPAEQSPAHRVRWYVYTGEDGERIPRASTMRGQWPGYDAECITCGWKSRTGGGTRRYVEDLVRDHKRGLR